MKHLKFYLFLIIFVFNAAVTNAQAIIIDHNCAFLEPIPAWAIQKASDSLHIAYGHTSHGSQITTGMEALANQSTTLKGYKGDIYCWDEYPDVFGDFPCLDIDDQFTVGDLGHYGDTTWAFRTRYYLDNKERAKDINVVMWSWCGGCSDNSDEGIQAYLDAMNNLEKDYPHIKFIYMTGHLDHWSDELLKHNNQLIRDYCKANNKILFDFADIESYDPDNNYFEFSNDNCDYYDSTGTLLGNWAEEWQNSHVRDVDWYECYAAHTKPLNGNRKAYAAWWMWARLVGWTPEDSSYITKQPVDTAICDSGDAQFEIEYSIGDSVRWQIKQESDTAFHNIYDNYIFSNANTTKLNVHIVNRNIKKAFFRCLLYVNDSTIISDTAELNTDKTIKAFVNNSDINICTGNVELQGEDPGYGQAYWTLIQGSGDISNPDNPITTVSNIEYGKNIFRYTVVNGVCADSTDVNVSRYDSIKYVSQTNNIEANTGDTVKLKIEYEGDFQIAQWYRFEIPINDGFKYLGTQTNELTIRNIEKSDSAYYYCTLWGYCNKITSPHIIISVLTATLDVDNTALVIYPNPAIDKVYFHTDKIIKNIKILNIKTQSIEKDISDINNNTIDIGNLENGMYILKINIEGSTIIKKLIKF